MKYTEGREHNYEYIFSCKLSVTLYIKHQSYEINRYPYEFETSVRSELLAQHSSKQIAQSFAQTKSLNRKYLLPIYGSITPPNKRSLKFRATGSPNSRIELSIPCKRNRSTDMMSALISYAFLMNRRRLESNLWSC